MRVKKHCCVATAILALAGLAAPANASTYYIDESTDFTGNGCPNTDLNNVGAALKQALIDDNWSGEYFKKATAWPQDPWDLNTDSV